MPRERTNFNPVNSLRDHIYKRMIKLRHLINENTGELTPRDIYNFYFLMTVASYHPEAVQTDYGKFIQDEYLKALKLKYTSLFKGLMYDQLRKYVSRGRVDADFPKEKLADGPSTMSAGELLALMQKTFRSDMQRRNDVWILAGSFLKQLESATTPKDIYLMIDRLNSAVHNTQTAILGKVSYDLTKVYDRIHKAKSLNDYNQMVDKDLRQLLNQINENKDIDFFGTADKRITSDTPNGFSPKPVFKDTLDKEDPSPEKKDFDFPL